MRWPTTELGAISRARSTASFGTGSLRSISQNYSAVTLSAKLGASKRVAFGAALIEAGLGRHSVGVEKVPLRVD